LLIRRIVLHLYPAFVQFRDPGDLAGCSIHQSVAVLALNSNVAAAVKYVRVKWAKLGSAESEIATIVRLVGAGPLLGIAPSWKGNFLSLGSQSDLRDIRQGGFDTRPQLVGEQEGEERSGCED